MKILMALMGMEIGGAETHVLELCKALKNCGHEIIVASNGGAYEKELQNYNIVHYKVPLHNKKINNLIKSYSLLKKIIIENKIKLVHAHARIPAFLCGLLQKKLDFRFVTTAHWIFKSSFPFNILTNWGEKTLAVSNDIKKYLIDNYNLDEKNIAVTINGIDTKNFSASVEYDDLIKEFGLSKNKKHIVCVSRLDKDRSLCAHKLLEIAPDICDGNAEIIIVGDGNDMNQIKSKADNINKDKKIVFLTGARTDINKFLALADIFVGVSRAALEAMAAKTPTILAGNEGYIGIFDNSNLNDAMQTNFCCRCCEIIDCEKLKTDIKKLLAMDQENLNQLAEFGYDTIINHYSIEKMADDALKIYETVRYQQKKIDVMISGYYGFNNNGDDSVLKSIIDGLKKERPNIKIMVLSRRPFETKKLYDVSSINRFNFLAIKKYMRQTNLLISGGGSLIQDMTSTHSLKYYLWVIETAIKNNVKVMLYSNGIGPIKRDKNRLLAAKILNQVDLITLRDKTSLNELEKLNVNKPQIIITADAAFNLNFNTANTAPLEFGIDTKTKYFVIAVRSWKYNSDGFEKNIAVFADYVWQKYNLLPVFVPMHPSNDCDITKKIMSLMQTKAKYIGARYATNNLLNLIAHAEFILAMRLHTIIYSIQTATPILALVYDPKVEAIMHEVNQNSYTSVEDLNLTNLKNLAAEILTNQNKIRAELKNYNDQFKKLSAQNTKLALDLVDQKIF